MSVSSAQWVTLLGAIVSLCCCDGAVIADGKVERPNVIVIVADDKYVPTEANAHSVRKMMQFRAEVA